MNLNPFKSPQAKANLEKNLNSAGGKRFKRIFIIAGAAFLITIVSIGLAQRSGGSPTRPSHLATPSARPVATNAVSDASVNPAYQSDLATDNRDRAVAASAKGESSLPSADPTGYKDYSKLPQQHQSVPLGTPPSSANNAQNNYDQQRESARAEDYRKLVAVFNSVPGAKSYAPQMMQVSAPSAGGAATTAANSTSSSTDSQRAGVRLASALDIGWAVLDSPVDTDGAKIIRAHMEGGPLDGAKLLGTQTMKNEQIDMKFTAMSWHGLPIQIDAIGMDEDTRDLLVNGVVDRKLWLRYGLPFFGNAMGIAGQLLATSGQQAIVSPLGAVTTATPILSPEKIALAAGGQSIGQIASALSAYAQQQKAKVTKKADAGIGVLFLSDVVYKGDQTQNYVFSGLAQRPADAGAGAQQPAVSAPVRAMPAQGIQLSPSLQQFAGQGAMAAQLQQQAVLQTPQAPN